MKEVKELLQKAFAEAVKNGVIINQVRFDFDVIKTIGNADELILNDCLLETSFIKDN